MPKIFEQSLSRSELLQRVGDISQIARITPAELVEGFERGSRSYQISTGGGLVFNILPDRGMDISTAHYNGMPLNWRSSTTDRHPAFFEHESEAGRGWLRSFTGGLVATCGLANAGAANIDGDASLGLHGRIGNTPATEVAHSAKWIDDEYVLEISGKLRETTVFGENLELRRTIRTKLGAASFELIDEVENLGFKPAEMMLLYHINVGYPFVDRNSRVISPTLSVESRDDIAKAKQEAYAHLQAPEPAYEETVYFHSVKPDAEGKVLACVFNPDLAPVLGSVQSGAGVYVEYLQEQLPRFTEWKMMDAGAYTVGLEPANCSVMGRGKEREAGTLQVLQPGETHRVRLQIGIICGDGATRLEHPPQRG